MVQQDWSRDGKMGWEGLKGCSGITRKPTYSSPNRWIRMDLHGIAWVPNGLPVDAHRFQWIFMGFHRFQCILN